MWLQTFCVKPKIVSGQQAECGGAMVGKMPNVTWLDGSFAETVKGSQSGWFYITEPHDANWAAAPEFRSGIPMTDSTKAPSNQRTLGILPNMVPPHSA